MSIKQPLSALPRIEGYREQERITSHNGRRRFWEKVITLILCGLALFCLLTTGPATLPFAGQKTIHVLVPLKPVGEAAIVTAPGFDTCVAPPAGLLKTWWDASPYRWLNVYLGGASMFPLCGGKYLTPQWVSAVYTQGWSLLPTWVGLQAPCARQRAVMSSDAAVSYIQGQTEADAAIKSASLLGFSRSSPIYFDMEYFSPNRPDGSRDTTCIPAVKAFLDGWNNELTTRGHFAGFYASASDYPMLGRPTEAAPAVAWIAGGGLWATQYNRACTVYGNHYISDNAWSSHQRIYQYTGGHSETYGRKTWNIDSDCADAPMVGHITAISLSVGFQQP